jgi:DNA-binding Lrp family transcriptional regulator
LMEERLKVLKVMNEVTSRLDLKEFARMVGLNPNQTIEHMQELVKAGLVRKVGGGYGITEKGRSALKALAPVPRDMEFQFYTGIGQPTGFAAKSLKDFYETVKQVAVDSLEFHLYRGDFENWIRVVFKDAAFADEFKNMKKMQLKGENLRREIIKAAEARYAFQKLL